MAQGVRAGGGRSRALSWWLVFPCKRVSEQCISLADEAKIIDSPGLTPSKVISGGPWGFHYTTLTSFVIGALLKTQISTHGMGKRQDV